ncbi:hypothetical protein CcCBS67573_g04508 [Chytriomyces confervae]|uniref:tyrosinase n=1 Tax=Chytriomyces confervae TaxID=246404 RepID=A0A507FDJ6_9FUNG|nr:hypothetical protein CcCBS67573_g04508 [Chytriomyces confervae]
MHLLSAVLAVLAVSNAVTANDYKMARLPSHLEGAYPQAAQAEYPQPYAQPQSNYGVHRAGPERMHEATIGSNRRMYVPVRKSSEAVVARMEVHDFFAPANIRQSSLFLQAFEYIKNLPETDSRSFAAISSIHGEPVGMTYDSFPGPKGPSNRGYCKHADPLFPIWHRPYIALIENVIIDVAVTVIAPKYTTNNAEWVAAARRIRFPFWDYASDIALKDPFPAIFTQQTVQIQVAPTGAAGSMRNPLVSFRLPANIYGQLQRSGMRNRETYRSGFLSTHEVAQTRAQVRLLFDETLEDWLAFSNTRLDGDDENNPRQFHSLEGIHNSIHGYLGKGTYMGNPASASFDPVFYFHHCNVDRLTALYQATNGGFPSASLAQTPLTPFRIRDGSNTAWNSNDAKTTEAFGYTYPELVNGTRGTQLSRLLMQKYTFVDPSRIVDTNPNRRRDSSELSARDGVSSAAPTYFGRARSYLQKAVTKAYQISGFTHRIEAEKVFTETRPVTEGSSEGDSVFAHYIVDMHSIDEPFTVNIKVDGHSAGKGYVFATPKNSASDKMMIGGNVVLTYELANAGILHKPELWKSRIEVEILDFEGDKVAMSYFPTLKVNLRACLFDAKDEDHNPQTQWSQDSVALYP